MADGQKEINAFLVEAFNRILRREQRALRQGAWSELSLSELHVLEAIGMSAWERSMKDVAESLEVTTGTKTVAICTLERKGYVARRRDTQDKRRVLLSLTDRGRQAFQWHAQFHHDMVAAIVSHLSEQETAALVRALAAVNTYFVQEATPKQR